MTGPRERLIRELAEDLAPRPALAPARRAALGWLAAAGAFVLLATLVCGPLRPGAFGQLVSEPSLALELLLGGAALAVACGGFLRLRVPGATSGLRGAAPALALAFAWLALEALLVPGRAQPPSPVGGRALCWLQVALFSLPPLALAFWLARRAAPLERAWTGLLAGLAAGALPALVMELACKHDPLHALGAHLAPALAVAAAGALLGPLALRRV